VWDAAAMTQFVTQIMAANVSSSSSGGSSGSAQYLQYTETTEIITRLG